LQKMRMSSHPHYHAGSSPMRGSSGARPIATHFPWSISPAATNASSGLLVPGHDLNRVARLQLQVEKFIAALLILTNLLGSILGGASVTLPR
jgi:hypothetical protein